MSDWTLVDCAPMVTDEADLPAWTVESEEQLRGELERFRSRNPASVIHLLSPEGAILHMGISSTLSGVQWKKGPQLRMALADRPYTDSGMDFRFQGTDSGFRQQYLFPVEKAIDAAASYYKTGQLPNWLQWAEWNSKTRRLETSSPAGPNGTPTTPSLSTLSGANEGEAN